MMLERINALCIGTYVKVKSFSPKFFAENLRRDERGLSGVVVAVLLILIAVLAVVALWKVLGKWLVDTWKDITDAEATITEPPLGGGS